MNNIMILLSGKAQSGKTTCANILEDDYMFRNFAQGDYVRDTVEKLFNLPKGYAYDDSHKNELIKCDGIQCTLRHALQMVGHNFRWMFNENIWTIRTSTQIITSSHPLISISDIRYHSDIQYLKDTFSSTYSIYHINIIAPNSQPIKENLHESESQILPLPDYEIINNMTNLMELKMSIHTILMEINN